LVEQDLNDESASELLKAIQEKKARFEKQGVIKSTKKVPLVEDDEVEFSLPSSWLWTRLNDIAQYIQRGKSPKYSNEEGPLVISQKCVQWSGLNLGLARYITKESLSEYDESRFLRQDDLLWNSTGTGTIGRIVRFALDYDRLVCDSHVTIVRCLLVSPEYVRLWLMSDHVYGNIEELASGSTNQVELTAQMAINQVLPLPPLAEQHRIVAKVDELMALCDRLEASQAKRESRRNRLVSASVKRIGQSEDVGNSEEFRDHVRFHLHHLPRLATRPEHVKELRQTILNLAVRGKLVPQDPNDEPASELLRKFSNRYKTLVRDGVVKKYQSNTLVIPPEACLFSPPNGWVWTTFGNLVISMTNGLYKPSKFYSDSGVACVRMYNISNGKLSYNNMSRVVLTQAELETYKLEEGDFLVNRVNSRELVGKAAVVKDMPELLIFEAMNIRVRLVEQSGVADYCNLVFLSSYVKSWILEIAKQAVGQASINQGQISLIPISLPPLTEQYRIVAKVDELMTLCDQLEVHLATNQTNQSQLLEATLCDALGVTCLPVSRLSRPAPSPTRVAATHSEQPFKPIAPRPVADETPKATVQGSLIEQPTQQVGRPRAANGDIPGAILGQMQPGQEYSRAQLTEALGLSVYEWNMAIRELKESRLVVQTGERRGARYSLTS